MIVKNLVSTKKYYDKNTGEEKKTFTKVGVIFIYEDGGMSVKIEAIPLNWDGIANAYEIDNRQGNEHDSRNNNMDNNRDHSNNSYKNNSMDNKANYQNDGSNGNNIHNSERSSVSREQQSMNYEKRQ